ncbi:MAG: 2'-5' RNA ligase family protein [Thermanaerothrix sp.]|nr:2'-5' RNA ligase family protein [Thermanaerothrix sp.]
MSYAVELYLDSATEAVVRQVWDRLADAAVSAVMRESGYRPHVSLGVGDGLDLEGAGTALEALAGRQPPFTLAFSYLGIFRASEATLFLGVTATRALLALHAEFQAHFQPFAQSIWDYYRVDAWVPHCTLAFGLPLNQVPSAVAITQEIALPLTAQAVALGITAISPTSSTTVRFFPLGGGTVLAAP